MSINVKRGTFDPEDGSFQYELQFKQVVDDDEIQSSVAVEVAFSVSENGELADITFMVPKLLLEGAIPPSDARPIGAPVSRSVNVIAFIAGICW